jgi:hypothetical protein
MSGPEAGFDQDGIDLKVKDPANEDPVTRDRVENRVGRLSKNQSSESLRERRAKFWEFRQLGKPPVQAERKPVGVGFRKG